MYKPKKILNIGHRGASAYELENTIASFLRAAEMGADMVELDLHLTKDGQIVIMHDYVVRQTTDGHGKIEDLTFAEIRTFHEKNGELIPTLAEVIEATSGKVGLYCELKTFGIDQPFVETINRFNVHSTVMAGSFMHPIVRAVKKWQPKIKTAVMVECIPVNPTELALAANADFFHFCWENRAAHPHTILTKNMLEELNRYDIGAILWHEEHVSELKHLLKLGVDAICSNKPDLVKRELAQLAV